MFEFEHPLAFLTEGPADAGFIRGVLTSNGRTNFHIRDTSQRRVDGVLSPGGIPYFREALSAFRGTTGFNLVTHIVVVFDNDHQPETNLNSVLQQVQDANFVRPDGPNVRSPGQPGITVVPIPWVGVPGNLETLCVPAIRSAAQNAQAAAAYAQAIGTANWPIPHKADISQVRVILAAYQNNPAIGIGKIWNEAPQLMPLAHESLEQIVAHILAQTP